MRSAHNPGTLIPKHAAVGAQVVVVVGRCRRSRASALRVLCLCRRVLVAARPQRDRRRRRDYDRGRRSRDGVRVVTLELARSVFHHSLALAPMGIRPSTSTCTVHEAHGKGKTMRGCLPESLTQSLANSDRYFSLLAGGHGICIALRRLSTESATPPLSPLECSIHLRRRG
jgi:hypothetical protein